MNTPLNVPSIQNATKTAQKRSCQEMRTPNPNLPHGCGRCDSRWGGVNTSHCGTDGCHRTFAGLAAFDKHRTGSHAAGTRHCIDPATVGLVLSSRSYECWTIPGDGTEWWAGAEDGSDAA